MKANTFKMAAWVMVVCLGLFAFIRVATGSIKGTVTPASSGVKAWAISGTDSLKTSIDGGAFNFTDVKPGTYKIVIEALPPYRNLAREGVTVSDNQATDVGEIKLQR